MTRPGTGENLPSLEIRVAAADPDLPQLERWARALDASVSLARPRVKSVTAVVADATSSGLSPERFRRAGSVDSWGFSALDPHRIEHAEADLVLLLSASAELAPRCLSELLAAIGDGAVGIVEPRWLPFQSAKPLDPTTMDVSWASAACYLVRREVLASTGGFDTEAFPGLGADVDHSWRTRVAGWSVRCVPTAAVFVHGTGPRGDPLLEPSVAAASAKLRLAATYGGPAAARAWASAWAAAGSVEERQAADNFVRGLMNSDGTSGDSDGDLGSARSSDTDVFVQELFSLQRDDPGEYPLAASALRSEWGEGDEGAVERPTAGQPFLSVVVRTQGRRPVELEDNLTSLAAQSCQDFEVLLVGHDLDPNRREVVESAVRSFPAELAQRIRVLEVSGGGRARPLNAALGEASGAYLTFLDDDDVALDSWVGEFRRVAEQHPGAVAWTQVAWQRCELAGEPRQPIWRVTEAPQLFVRQFDLVAHLHENGTPNCGIAVPSAVVRMNGLSFSEELAVFEDWEMVLRLAQLAPFRPTGAVTALYRRGSPDSSGVSHGAAEWEESAAQVIERLGAAGFLVRGEHLPRLHEALAELDELRRRVGAADDRSDDSGATGRSHPPLGRPITSEHFDGLGTVVVGAHLDDAVLSCGELISGLGKVAVLTVFAGEPRSGQPLTDWDRGCGFASEDDVVAARVAEDEHALAVVGATAVRLAFRDEQYRDGSTILTAGEVGEAVLAAVRSIGTGAVVFPLGIGHDDHRLAAAAALWACEQAPELEWFAYQDLPYGYEENATDELLERLGRFEPEAVSFPGLGDKTLKQAAVDCYASQLDALGDDRRSLAFEPERYWRLRRTSPDASENADGSGPLR
jgi:GT2 family glycosyltransferase/LmbE family N-acetylglucosaminyl deacetylase